MCFSALFHRFRIVRSFVFEGNIVEADLMCTAGKRDALVDRERCFICLEQLGAVAAGDSYRPVIMLIHRRSIAETFVGISDRHKQRVIQINLDLRSTVILEAEGVVTRIEIDRSFYRNRSHGELDRLGIPDRNPRTRSRIRWNLPT